ncbi:MAG TPA: Ku protein [Gemmatimonadales bacterium]|jgi:DNA end-binding protein Ku|nr:Ku protein [Gemmatimonadales bacterium]
MAKAIWSGSISFGMVTIPVKLYGATQSKDIRFHLLHATDGARLQQKRWCPTDDAEVPWSETVRGYEYAKGQYVVLTEEDFERLPLPSKHTIDLSAFVEEREIDPVFYERSYYLEPGERAEKPYALLLKALAEKKLSAVATITIRQKEQLCVLRPHEDTMMLETLYYPDEVRLERGVDPSNVKVSDRELDMAFTLIDILRRPFDPAEYHDHYREALAELIEAKLEGKQVVKAPATREARVFDLADALKRSVEAAKKAKPKPPARARSRTARSARRTRKVG